MANYWTKKDDQSDELRTIKPWEEEISNGDKFIPDPKREKAVDGQTTYPWDEAGKMPDARD